jgi:hypothetical protein
MADSLGPYSLGRRPLSEEAYLIYVTFLEVNVAPPSGSVVFVRVEIEECLHK